MVALLISNKKFSSSVHYHTLTSSWTSFYSVEEWGPELPRRLSVGSVLSIFQGILLCLMQLLLLFSLWVCWKCWLFEIFCHFRLLGFVCGSAFISMLLLLVFFIWLFVRWWRFIFYNLIIAWSETITKYILI